MSKKVLKIAYFLICTIIILTKESYGYLDPSAMTYIIQIIAAVGITIATSVGIFFYKIKKCTQGHILKNNAKKTAANAIVLF